MIGRLVLITGLIIVWSARVFALPVDVMTDVTIGNNIPGYGVAAVGVYGQYNASLPNLTSGNYSAIQVDSHGQILISGGGGGGGGGGVVTQPTASLLNATVIGAGTAGTPNAGVVSIQGVSGGVAVPVTGSFSATTVFPYSGTSDAQTATTASVLGIGAYNGTTYDRLTDTASRALTTSACDPTTVGRCATVTATNALKTDGSAVTQPVSGTFWQATQPVSGTVTVSSLSASLPAGANTIGAVTQASGPWTNNLTQVGSTTLGAPTAAGVSATGNIIGVQGVTGGTAQPVSCATAATCPTNATLQAGSTTAVTQATAANLNAAVVGVGTAGTPSGGVLSVQGVAGGTTQPVNLTQVNGVSLGSPVAAGFNAAGNVLSVQGVSGGVYMGVSCTPGFCPVVGVGTAGTPSGGVLTVQGSASGTAQPVSCATAATCPVNASQVAGPWTQNLTQLNGTSLGSPSAAGVTATGNIIGVQGVTGGIAMPVTVSNLQALGQGTMANSQSVTIASDQTAITASTNQATPGTTDLIHGLHCDATTHTQCQTVDTTGVAYMTAGGKSTAAVVAGTGNTVVKGTPGRLVRYLITAAGTTGNATCYDNATTNSGTVIAIIDGTTSMATAIVGYVSPEISIIAANGITCAGATGSPGYTVMYY